MERPRFTHSEHSPCSRLNPNISSKFSYSIFRYSGRMHYLAVAQVLILRSLANGSPVIAKRIFGANFAAPVNGYVQFIDGQPLLGPSKTIRGIVVSLVVTASGAIVLGLYFRIGLVAGTSMAGDLFSSFLKHRRRTICRAEPNPARRHKNGPTPLGI
jgi:hypothetical protein